MILFKEILIKALQNDNIYISSDDFEAKLYAIIQSESYNALSDIRDVLDNEELSDSECFKKIEEIVCIFEKLGSNGGSRHDF